MFITKQLKNCLSNFDSKRYINANGITTIPFGHYRFGTSEQDSDEEGDNDQPRTSTQQPGSSRQLPTPPAPPSAAEDEVVEDADDHPGTSRQLSTPPPLPSAAEDEVGDDDDDDVDDQPGTSAQRQQQAGTSRQPSPPHTSTADATRAAAFVPVSFPIPATETTSFVERPDSPYCLKIYRTLYIFPPILNNYGGCVW